MFLQIFEWGKTDSSYESRSEAEANIVRTAQKYAWNFHSVDQVLKDHGGYMTWADYEYLSQHQESAHPMIAPLDHSIRVSERVLHLERAHFFLGSSDTDYHCPLLVTLREATIYNWRQRSTAGWDKIAAKKAKKGKGKGKDQYRVSDQSPTKGQGKAPKPWNQPGQRRSVYFDPEDEPADSEDDSWGQWAPSSTSQGWSSWSSWAGTSWSGW